MTMTCSDILSRWTDAIEKRDIERVLSLYNSAAVLIPTFSDTILDTPDRIRRYFERLTERQCLQLSLHGRTVHEQMVSDSVSVLRGIYTWKFIVDEELITYEARFSFVMDLKAEAPIVHHHSSQIPRTV